jgi:hypothetical protein
MRRPHAARPSAPIRALSAQDLASVRGGLLGGLVGTAPPSTTPDLTQIQQMQDQSIAMATQWSMLK